MRKNLTISPLHFNFLLRSRIKILVAVAVIAPAFASAAEDAAALSVYSPVPGLEFSPHYRFRVKQVGSAKWLRPFAWITVCPEEKKLGGHYTRSLGGWSNTYCNFEMKENTPIVVEIIRLDKKTGRSVDIKKATPHPRRKVRDWQVRDGKVYVYLDQPALFAVDIDGQLDDQMAPKTKKKGTCPFTGENAIHTVTVFANPFLKDKPNPDDPGVLLVEPGVPAPNEGDWHTLYFKPGVHRLYKGDGIHPPGDTFKLRDNRKYYIPGDAIVYGNMINVGEETGKNIRLFGHGTLSGAQTPHPAFGPIAKSSGQKKYYWNAKLYYIKGGERCSVEGITFADPANHTCNVGKHPENFVRWSKAFTWRANGDGMAASGGALENCFLRTQDDGTYFTEGTYRNNVYWTDANGRPLRGSHMLNRKDPEPVLVEDIDIIYARSQFGGGHILGGKGFLPPKENNDGSHFTFRNINVEDPMPAKGFISFDAASRAGKPGTITGVRFENIRAVSESLWGYKNTLLGRENFRLSGFVFDNFIMAGKQIDSMDEFEHNEFVHGTVFSNAQPERIRYLNRSGYRKWYMGGDWSSSCEPADHDVVYHTSISGSLVVDGPAYAGRLFISHKDSASLIIRNHGHLSITGELIVGNDGGKGELILQKGTLELRNQSADALCIEDGTLRIEDGILSWRGNHVDAIKTLFCSKQIAVAKGRKEQVSTTVEPGHTTVWAEETTRTGRGVP